VDFGVVGRYIAGVVLDPDPGPDQAARSAITIRKRILWLAVSCARLNPILFLSDAEAKILPKIIRAKRDSFFSCGIPGRALCIDLIISGSELDVDFEKDGVTTGAVVELRLLCTVDARAGLGDFDDLRQWGKQTYLRNIGATPGKWQVADVRLEEGACLLVAVLAKKVCVSNSRVGEFHIVCGRGRGKQQRGGKQDCENAESGKGHGASYSLDVRLPTPCFKFGG
jgi:hypothetical protein